MYDGNDITGGEDKPSRSPRFRKAITGKSMVWTYVFREAELTRLNVNRGFRCGATRRLPGIEEVLL
jgi:hypothetical protein